MSSPLMPLQRSVHEFIAQAIEENGSPPSKDELHLALGISREKLDLILKVLTDHRFIRPNPESADELEILLRSDGTPMPSRRLSYLPRRVDGQQDGGGKAVGRPGGDLGLTPVQKRLLTMIQVFNRWRGYSP